MSFRRRGTEGPWCWCPAGRLRTGDGGRSRPRRIEAGGRLAGGGPGWGFGSGATRHLAVRRSACGGGGGLPREAMRGGGERLWRRPAGGGGLEKRGLGLASPRCQLRPLARSALPLRGERGRWEGRGARGRPVSAQSVLQPPRDVINAGYGLTRPEREWPRNPFASLKSCEESPDELCPDLFADAGEEDGGNGVHIVGSLSLHQVENSRLGMCFSS